jgi:hypothetical protein
MRLSPVVVVALLACRPSQSPDPKDPTLSEVLQRLDVVEARLTELESRSSKASSRSAQSQGKTSGATRSRSGKNAKAKAPPEGERVTVSLDGDADRVVLAGPERTWRLPRRVPPGDYWLLVAFGEEKLERHLEVTVFDIDQRVHCDASSRHCTVVPAATAPTAP